MLLQRIRESSAFKTYVNQIKKRIRTITYIPREFSSPQSFASPVNTTIASTKLSSIPTNIITTSAIQTQNTPSPITTKISTAKTYFEESIADDGFLSKPIDPTSNSSYIMGLDFLSNKRKFDLEIVDISKTDKTLQTAKNETIEMLKFTYLPSKLSTNTREDEFNQIFDLVNNAILSSDGIPVYAYGLPGTGKKIVVSKVLQKISDIHNNEKFKIINIPGNCITSDTDNQWIWKQIGFEIDPISFDPTSIFKKESQRDFMNKRNYLINNHLITTSGVKDVFHVMAILVIEDMHMINNSTLQFLVKISNKKNSKLIIIGTGHDEKLMSIYQVKFEKYNNYELTQILADRVVGKIVTHKAIQEIATKFEIIGMEIYLSKRKIINFIAFIL